MNAGYDFNQILVQYEQWMGMSLFAAIFSELPSMLLGVATYVLTALALHTLAKRRGIHNPWLAWIPFGSSWLLGCISDQYRAVACGETKNRRKVLLVLDILLTVFAIATVALCIVMVLELLTMGLDSAGTLDQMTESTAATLLASLLGPAMGMLLMSIPMAIAGITFAVFYYIALHDVYKSCDPANATLFTVLSVLFNITLPMFLFFVCRNKDDGMPQRTGNPVTTPEMPTGQEPWEQERE